MFFAFCFEDLQYFLYHCSLNLFIVLVRFAYVFSDE